MLSIFLAALCHDLDHPGVNHDYLVNSGSYLTAIHGVSLNIYFNNSVHIIIFYTSFDCLFLELYMYKISQWNFVDHSLSLSPSLPPD